MSLLQDDGITGATMIIPKTAASVLQDHTTLEVECIDRMYMNVYMPQLQSELGVVGFFRKHRGAIFASSALMDPISRSFATAITKFVAKEQVPVITFVKGQRKDDVSKEHLAAFSKEEGVLFLGKAQEKASVFRTEKRRDAQTGLTYPWIVRSTAMVNYYYFYCVDRDFGPFFIKFCSYFPYTGKLCINGHEYVKRQLTKEGIAHTALDNGIASCENPERLQQICDSLDAAKIETFFAKWLAILPSPYTQEDRNAGYHYQLSMLQTEFSLTQMLDRPVAGRVFFEQVIKENLDIGRPDQVQLIFERRVTKRTPGRFRTRVITEGVIPSLHLDYKNTRIKQYHKEGRALRTETTINNTRDFGVGKRLSNLAKLRQIGFAANRRLLDVQRISHDPTLAEEAIRQMQEPITVNGVRTSAMPFADQRTHGILQALPIFRLQADGFASKDFRIHLAALNHQNPDQIRQGQISYHLRRLKLRGLIERIPKSHRYRVTDAGLRVSISYTRAYHRILRPGIAQLGLTEPMPNTRIAIAFNRLRDEIDSHCWERKLTA
jgi:hypothetical protein